MKIVFAAALAFFLFAGPVAAQEHFSAAAFNGHLGKTGTICDTVYSFRIVSDTLTRLSMGGVYPHQKYTIVIKGNKINLNWTLLKGKPLCVTGVFMLIKGQAQIEVTEPGNINKISPD